MAKQMARRWSRELDLSTPRKLSIELDELSLDDRPQRHPSGLSQGIVNPSPLVSCGKKISLEKAESVCRGGAFWPAAVVSLIMGVLSVVPYNMILESDPGSPLFISFVTHIFFVVINARVAPTLLCDRKFPLIYHAGFVCLGYLFNVLKSDATKRLPTSVGMVLLNLQILVGVIVELVAFGRRYSASQLLGCGAVTVGVALAGRAAKAQSKSGTVLSGMELAIGTTEMVGALVALTLLSILVKAAFDRYGESVDEQIFTQHLCSLPLFLLGSQWNQIGPRMSDWVYGGNRWTVFLLLGNVALTFGDRAASVQMAGRAPNLLLVQLVETLKKFLSLLLAALLSAPPLPPLSFWVGSLVLACGTVQFLYASSKNSADGGADKAKVE